MLSHGVLSAVNWLYRYCEIPNSSFVSCHPADAYIIQYESDRDGMTRTSILKFRSSPCCRVELGRGSCEAERVWPYTT